jgi:putative flippase GtrA
MDWLKIYSKIKQSRFIHFMIVGSTGVGLNLGLVWLLTEYVFGKDNYYYAYLIGLVLNLIYVFVMHTLVTFKTKANHKKRFMFFVLYHLTMSFIQANIVRVIVPIFGQDYYILIIASVILSLSMVTFLVFKLKLFKEEPCP